MGSLEAAHNWYQPEYDMSTARYGAEDVNRCVSCSAPMLTNRMRLQETRLVPPASARPEFSRGGNRPVDLNPLHVPHAPSVNNSYYQSLRDATLHDSVQNLSNSLLNRVRSSAVRSHYGRCGSGWSNVATYRDYSGRHYMFVDGQVSENERAFKKVKQNYLRSQLHSAWPEVRQSHPDAEIPAYSTGDVIRSYGAQIPHSHAESSDRLARAHGLRHHHDHKDFEMAQARGGAMSLDVSRILTNALRDGSAGGRGSRYSWNPNLNYY